VLVARKRPQECVSGFHLFSSVLSHGHELQTNSELRLLTLLTFVHLSQPSVKGAIIPQKMEFGGISKKPGNNSGRSSRPAATAAAAAAATKHGNTFVVPQEVQILYL